MFLFSLVIAVGNVFLLFTMLGFKLLLSLQALRSTKFQGHTRKGYSMTWPMDNTLALEKH